jgi:hypothetical protein
MCGVSRTLRPPHCFRYQDARLQRGWSPQGGFDKRVWYSAKLIMKLEVLHLDQNQAIGLFGEVYLIVRWALFAHSDLEYVRSALAHMTKRSANGFAFLQVNRFEASQRISMDETAQAGMLEIMRAHGTSASIVALVLPNNPFEMASVRSMFARLGLTSKVRLDVRLFSDLREAVSAVCEKLTASGHTAIRPLELEVALAELERQKLPPAGKTR